MEMNTADATCRELAESHQEKIAYGCWTKDDAGLPCFDGFFDSALAVDKPFTHGLSSGRLNALVNRQGLVHLFTTEGGYTDFSFRDSRIRSGLYLNLIIDGEWFSLLHDDLQQKGAVRYGIGYARFQGVWKASGLANLTVEQEFFTPPDNESRMCACFRLLNHGNRTLAATLRVRADIAPARLQPEQRAIESEPGRICWRDFHPGLGDYQLEAEPGFSGVQDCIGALILERRIELAPGEEMVLSAQVGYGASPLKRSPAPADSRKAWDKKLQHLGVNGVEGWVKDEAIWSAGQLYSFAAFDRSVNENYLNLGGYGWAGFGVREVPETAITVVEHDLSLALSCLRWTAKLQYANGDLPHCHAFQRRMPGEKMDTGHFESDNEIWFLLAAAEVLRTAGDLSLLAETVPYWEDETGTLLDHLKRAFYWIRDGIGVGRHGLIRIVEGDWNDYLSGIGRGGSGESMMNTGMCCAALSRLVPLLNGLDSDFVEECEAFLEELRSAAAAGFDGGWFVRGYTDEGAPFGSYEEDRVFLNAQSWCVLGRCGTLQMRESAMREALARCFSPMGLTLMSRPYACPPPATVSQCAIPAGDGENAGIWPQTVHWAVWALTELGWREEAMEVWKRMSLRNHARLYPDVPFGIFNGPDCYSSHFAGEREGWSQVEMLARASFPPMNPMVAWQAFSLRRILMVNR